MLETSVIEGTNVISVTVDGSISADEEAQARNSVDQVVSDHGSVRMLLDYGGIDLGRVEPQAVVEDLKGARLLDDIERVGVVADSDLLDTFLTAVNRVVGVDVRTFDQRDEAVAWLTA